MDFWHSAKFIPKDLPKVNAEKAIGKPYRLVVPRGEGIRQVDQRTKVLPMVTWKRFVQVFGPEFDDFPDYSSSRMWEINAVVRPTTSELMQLMFYVD